MRADGRHCHDPFLRCAFYGGAQTALGVTQACILAHSPQGCQLVVDAAYGWQQADYIQTKSLCTKLCEDEIVHGGEDILARTLDEARTFDVPVVIVLAACGPEIVGDDIRAVCRRAEARTGMTVIPIACAGFRGSQYDGTDLALDALLERFGPGAGATDGAASGPRACIPRSVTIVAPHANANPTWIGDLGWVLEILDRLRIEVTCVLTHSTPIGSIPKAFRAEGSLLLSHDCGFGAVERLEREGGVRRLCADLPLPIGLGNTRRWLARLGEEFGAEAHVAAIADEGERWVAERLRRRGLETQFFSRSEAALSLDATIGLPMLRFLVEDLEMLPRQVLVRSDAPAAKALMEAECRSLGITPEVIWRSDAYAVKDALRRTRPSIVFGSNIELHMGRDLDIPFVFPLANPVARFRLTDREYFGYRGLLNVIESVQNDWWDRWKSKSRRYAPRW